MTVSWKERYADKILTPAEAAALVRPGDRVATGMPEVEPLLAALAARSELTDVTMLAGPPRPFGMMCAEHPGIDVSTFFLTPFVHDSDGEVELIPLNFHAWSGSVRRFAARVRVVVVAEPDPDGTVFPGGIVAYDDALVHGARRPDDIVIGIVDVREPKVAGYRYDVSDFDYLVEFPTDASGAKSLPRKPAAGLEVFAERLDPLIPDGATIQVGVGSATEGSIGLLTHKRDLGIHTEVLSPGMLDLVDAGCVTNAHTVAYPGVTVATVATPECYERIDGNPAICIAPSEQVLDPRRISLNPTMRCVNSAIEVDLLGQVNAEMIGGRQLSGVGGQLDFLRATNLAPDALSIVVLRSTTGSGQSRIIPWMSTNVSTASRHETHVVVTEHGTAVLQDATVRQRAERLIAIAHPDHRDALADEAIARGVL